MLKTSGVKFQACDQPHANEITIDILAAVAEDEVRRISDRTSKALQALKSQGVPLGSHRPECANNLSEASAKLGRALGAKSQRARAAEAYADLMQPMLEMRANGATLQAIADVLNNDGQTTRRGDRWTPTQVSRVLASASQERGNALRV